MMSMNSLWIFSVSRAMGVTGSGSSTNSQPGERGGEPITSLATGAGTGEQSLQATLLRSIDFLDLLHGSEAERFPQFDRQTRVSARRRLPADFHLAAVGADEEVDIARCDGGGDAQTRPVGMEFKMLNMATDDPLDHKLLVVADNFLDPAMAPQVTQRHQSAAISAPAKAKQTMRRPA